MLSSPHALPPAAHPLARRNPHPVPPKTKSRRPPRRGRRRPPRPHQNCPRRRPTGWDDGALGFEESAVWFSGRATSFRIAAPDILPGTYALSGIEAVTDGEALQQGLPLRHPTRKVWIQVEVLVVTDRNEWEDEARLIHEVKRLRARTDGEGGSQYPPLSPRPGLVRSKATLYKFRAAFALIGICLMGLSSLLSEWADDFCLLVGALFVMVALGLTDGVDPTVRRIAAEEETA